MFRSALRLCNRTHRMRASVLWRLPLNEANSMRVSPLTANTNAFGGGSSLPSAAVCNCSYYCTDRYLHLFPFLCPVWWLLKWQTTESEVIDTLRCAWRQRPNIAWANGFRCESQLNAHFFFFAVFVRLSPSAPNISDERRRCALRLGVWCMAESSDQGQCRLPTERKRYVSKNASVCNTESCANPGHAHF